MTADTTDEALRVAIWKTFEDNLDARIDEGQAYIHGIGDNVDELIALIHSREQEIFRRVETEVIGADEDAFISNNALYGGAVWNQLKRARNHLRSEQRTALATIKGKGGKTHE